MQRTNGSHGRAFFKKVMQLPNIKWPVAGEILNLMEINEDANLDDWLDGFYR